MCFLDLSFKSNSWNLRCAMRRVQTTRKAKTTNTYRLTVTRNNIINLASRPNRPRTMILMLLKGCLATTDTLVLPDVCADSTARISKGMKARPPKRRVKPLHGLIAFVSSTELMTHLNLTMKHLTKKGPEGEGETLDKRTG